MSAHISDKPTVFAASLISLSPEGIIWAVALVAVMLIASLLAIGNLSMIETRVSHPVAREANYVLLALFGLACFGTFVLPDLYADWIGQVSLIAVSGAVICQFAFLVCRQKDPFLSRD